MSKKSDKLVASKPASSNEIPVSTTQTDLRYLAFDNSAQASIISTTSNGKIVLANAAACRLFGYTNKQLLSKTGRTIFDEKEDSFKQMLKTREAKGKSYARVTAVKKNGEQFICEISSAVFLDAEEVENSITTITDVSAQILKQETIDHEKEQIVAEDILIAKSEQHDIDIKKEKEVADNIAIALSKQRKADLKNVKEVAHNIAMSLLKQEKIDSKKEKIVAENIEVALAKSDARLEENNQWVKYIARASYDVMWDWDIESGEIYVGDSLHEVFGYTIENNTIQFVQFTNCLLPNEKEIVEKKLKVALASDDKKWKAYYMMKREDGTIASTISRASIVRNEEGKAIRLIGATQDVSRLHDLENKLEQQIALQEEDSEKFLLAARVSSDIIWDWNLLTSDVFIGEGFEELFGYHIQGNTGNISALTSHIHPADKKIVETSLQNAIASDVISWEHFFRFIRADGTIANVFKKASILRDANGKAYRIIGALHDFSLQKDLEDKLEMEIKLKGKKIEEAMQESREAERSDIGKELHDNVNQLLSASKLYLDMGKKGGLQTEMYLSKSTEYTLSAIEEIRKLTKGLTSDTIKDLGICVAIEGIARDMMQVSELEITCHLDNQIEQTVNYKFKHNVFRIIQEQISNIIKHAVATKVTIQLAKHKEDIKLTIADNGVGFDTTKKRSGIGLDNINNRAEVFKGKATFVSKAGEGCILTVLFPFTDILVIKSE